MKDILLGYLIIGKSDIKGRKNQFYSEDLMKKGKWTESITSAKIFTTIENARSVFDGEDFTKNYSVEPFSYDLPPKMIHSLSGISIDKIEDFVEIAIVELKTGEFLSHLSKGVSIKNFDNKKIGNGIVPELEIKAL